jgi:hypothetical protein
MKRILALSLTVGIIVVAGTVAGSIAAYAKPTKPAPRITASQAAKAAVAKIPGKVISTKYEFEDGHWQYAVLVQKGKTLYEVEVNAANGKVLDTEKTTMAEERAEAAADQAASHHKKPHTK